jgi:hypothetical protein
MRLGDAVSTASELRLIRFRRQIEFGIVALGMLYSLDLPFCDPARPRFLLREAGAVIRLADA